MLKVSAKEYIELGKAIEQARVIFLLTERHSSADSGRGLSDREQEGLRKILIQIFDLCTALNLPIAGDLISQHFDLDHVMTMTLHRAIVSHGNDTAPSYHTQLSQPAHQT
jgi:hypothetical protein